MTIEQQTFPLTCLKETSHRILLVKDQNALSLKKIIVACTTYKESSLIFSVNPFVVTIIVKYNFNNSLITTFIYLRYIIVNS